MRIVDAHHHLWDLGRHRYPWLSDQPRQAPYGDYSAIRRDYLARDYLADIGDLPVVKSVHVQAEIDPADPVAETRWLQEVADAGAGRGMPNGIVAFADLSRPDAPQVIERHLAFPNLRGIRQMLYFGPAAGHLGLAAWRDNFARLAGYGLSFDLQILPRQAAEAAEVVAAHPGVAVILDHAGSPVQDGEGWQERWLAGMRRLAALPNVAVKLSGFGMFDRHWTADSVRPLVREAIELFGPERCMLASNFPVDGLMTDYRTLWQRLLGLIDGFSAAERDAMLAGNAERIYRV